MAEEELKLEFDATNLYRENLHRQKIGTIRHSRR